MTVRWTQSAINDLESIADYLHENAPAIAPDIVTELYTGTMALGSMPYVGRMDGRGNNRRLLLAGHYIVTYRIEGATVHVGRIRHTSRKPLKS